MATAKTELTFRRFTAFAAAWMLVSSGACGEEAASADDAEEQNADATDDVAGAADTAKVFQFDPDALDSDTAAADVAANTEDISKPGDATEPPRADATTPKVTSCKGSCGLYLEDNPCHCHGKCQAEGNCCGDFAVMCTCKTNADCNDANPCTTDSCKGGTCKQIPFQNCCQSDKECKGSTKCKTATCLDGGCQLIDKNCDDGLACTVDACDANSGGCVNKLPPTKCLIDGFCAQAGDKMPGSSGCQLCQPDIDATAWTAKAGTCSIEGKCYSSGTENPAVTCLVCNAKAAGDKWSVKSGHCFIDGACFVSGQSPAGGAGCATCKPSQSQTSWSGTAGTCAIGAGANIKCLPKGSVGPGGACQVCEPSKSTAGFTLQSGWCFIEDKCFKAGESGLAEQVCGTCEPAKSATTWTPKKAGEKCDDGDACTDATLCNQAGKCVGKTLPGCCKQDADCAHLKPQAKPCEVPICLKGSGKCELKKLSADLCCTQGKCCDVASQQVKAKGTQCSTFKVGTQFRCDGSNVEKRDMFPGCSGQHGNECKTGAEFHAGGPWKVIKTCGAKQTCTFKDASTQPTCK